MSIYIQSTGRQGDSINSKVNDSMSKSPQEWLKQADYYIKTAEIIFDNNG